MKNRWDGQVDRPAVSIAIPADGQHPLGRLELGFAKPAFFSSVTDNRFRTDHADHGYFGIGVMNATFGHAAKKSDDSAAR